MILPLVLIFVYISIARGKHLGFRFEIRDSQGSKILKFHMKFPANLAITKW